MLDLSWHSPLFFSFFLIKQNEIWPLTSHFVHAVKIGLRHPDPVVETSSLSSVNPPDVWYRVSIPEETTDRGCLSALQLEAITYAAQVVSYKWINKWIGKDFKNGRKLDETCFWVQWKKVMYAMLLYHSNMRLSCLEGNEPAIWLVMEPVWAKAGLLQESFMRITFWAGRGHSGK